MSPKNQLNLNSVTLCKICSMNIEATKLELMQLLLQTEKESLLNKLKKVFEEEYEDIDKCLIREEGHGISTAHKKELDTRIESYKNSPNDVLEWGAVKNDW